MVLRVFICVPHLHKGLERGFSFLLRVAASLSSSNDSDADIDTRANNLLIPSFLRQGFARFMRALLSSLASPYFLAYPP